MSNTNNNNNKDNDDDKKINYITYSEHRRLLKKIDNRIIDACKNDCLLANLVPILSACPNPDIKYNQMIIDHIYCRNSMNRSIPIKIRSFDNRIYEVFLRKMSTTNSVSLNVIRCSIERDLSFQCQIQSNQQGRHVRKFFRKINWKRLWQQYDLIIIDQHSSNRIDLSKNSNEQFELPDNCCMEFIRKSFKH